MTLLLLGGIWLGNRRWAESAPVLRQQAQAAMDANDLAGAETLLTRAVAADPADLDNYYALGVVQAQLGESAGGRGSPGNGAEAGAGPG